MTARFIPAAEEEMLEAVAAYELEVEDLGRRFLDEVYQAVDFLQSFPSAGPEIRPSIRRWALRRFPYAVFYRPEDDGGLTIIAVGHDKRRPGFWRERV